MKRGNLEIDININITLNKKNFELKITKKVLKIKYI